MKQSINLTKYILGILIGAIIIVGILSLRWLFLHPIQPAYDQIIYPILFGLYISFIPLSVGVAELIKFIYLATHKEAFTRAALLSIQKIKLATFMFCGVFVLIFPFIFRLGDMNDAPGLILFGSLPILISFVTANLFSLLQGVLEDGHQMEQDIDTM